MGRHHTLSVDSRVPGFDDRRLHLDFDSDYSDEDSDRFANTAFDTLRSPLAPSDVNEDGDSDDSQTSLRTPEEGDGLPLATPVVVQGPIQSGAHSQQQSVSRVNSSRPHHRNASSLSPTTLLTPTPDFEPVSPSTTLPQSSRPTRPPPFPTSRLFRADSSGKDAYMDELIASRVSFLGRVCNALDLVRTRARDEGWKLVRATLTGAPINWVDTEAERSLETKAKRRAWSAGIKIPAPYISKTRSSSALLSRRRVWDGSAPMLGSLTSPPGLASSPRKTTRALGPIVPTGLSLGVPVRTSPLAMYVWGAGDVQNSTPSKYGALSPVRHMETMLGNRPPRTTFPGSPTKLFPVCEEEGDDSFEPVQADAISFPQAERVSASAQMSSGDIEIGVIDGPENNEDDPFYFPPLGPRTRTTSMYVMPPTSAADSPVLPMFRPCAPPPPYRAAVGEGHSPTAGSEGVELGPSALLCQPLSSLRISSPPPRSPSPRPAMVSNPPFVPRLRSVSLPTPKSGSSMNKGHCSHRHKDERYEDLSQAYAAPPPDGPLIVSASPAPHEGYPTYAHVHSPIPATGKGLSASALGGKGREVIFEQAGSEFTLGLEVALGRAEEGRVVW
ncbi:hypothetical protein PAXRUDRAFT_623340 [Paxillus rubicundulus Ve08.2h10]|uniref:Uncharacterized protein n=1 Tax=Paxillus rubicundulus Ve08.2h10 TaxID=930991 RepID=A0A0D0E8W6_9AGAM|nr:hypothetical protein PAXRUDRAFT_623340 [Paxillus rubicundulus Ve08.2h10]